MSHNGLKRRRPFGHDDHSQQLFDPYNSFPLRYDAFDLAVSCLLDEHQNPSFRLQQYPSQILSSSPPTPHPLQYHHYSPPVASWPKKPRLDFHISPDQACSPLFMPQYAATEKARGLDPALAHGFGACLPRALAYCMSWEALCSSCTGACEPSEQEYHPLPQQPPGLDPHRQALDLAIPPPALPLPTTLPFQPAVPNHLPLSQTSSARILEPACPSQDASESNTACIPAFGESGQAFPIVIPPVAQHQMLYPRTPASPYSSEQLSSIQPAHCQSNSPEDYQVAFPLTQMNGLYSSAFPITQLSSSPDTDSQAELLSLAQETSYMIPLSFPPAEDPPLMPFTLAQHSPLIGQPAATTHLSPDDAYYSPCCNPTSTGSGESFVLSSDIHPAITELNILSDQPKKLGATRRGPFKNIEARQLTAETRKIGSCIRCKMQRIRCQLDPVNPTGPCLTCQKLASARIWRLPCLRYKITDVKLNKPGQVRGFEWTRRWKDNVVENITSWASEDIRQLRISEGLTKTSITVFVREFNPQEGDQLYRSWVPVHSGQKKCVRIPPFAICDLDGAREAYIGYIDMGLIDCLNHILAQQDGLMRATYMLGWNRAHDQSVPMQSRQLLILAFRLWMAVRLASKSAMIVGNDTLGDETLGMKHTILDETNPNHGQIPIPPVMGAQLDMIIIHHIETNLRRSLLINLQKLSQANQAQNWLDLYLVFFILLHNTALLTAHDAGYARKHGTSTRFAREESVREYHNGANVLLAYFHYCNKGVWPFSQACKDQDLKNLAQLDELAITFVKRTRIAVQKRRTMWDDVRKKKLGENGYFFVSQLFDECWTPSPFDAGMA